MFNQNKKIINKIIIFGIGVSVRPRPMMGRNCYEVKVRLKFSS